MTTEYDVKRIIVLVAAMTAHMMVMVFYFFPHIMAQIEVKQSVTTNNNGHKAGSDNDSLFELNVRQ
jgi:hypothetical protein